METARAYYIANSGTIRMVLYLIVFGIVAYYVYKWVGSSSSNIVTLSSVRMPANNVSTKTISEGKLPAIRPGGECTISLWMYINSYEYNSGKPKRVFTLVDSKVPEKALAVGILYPNEPKMMIRFATKKNVGVDYTNLDTLTNFVKGNNSGSMFANTVESPQCDLDSIDLQRWINITMSVNGKIVDVYMDGKLSRSCVLPDIVMASNDGVQKLTFGGPDGFAGFFGKVYFADKALTPDRIYGLYQSGPYAGIDSGFLGFLGEKLGIRLVYGS
jgi:hypothetical protein